MTISLAPSNLATYFNVYAPGSGPGDQAIANSGLTGANVPDLNRFDGMLETSGEYTISVYMMRSAARRNEVSDYTLDVAITGETGPVVTGDYADGLQGGPDYYAVQTTGGGLNLRAGPSAGAGLVAKLANGTQLRNLGCRMTEGRRWCRVATLADPGYEGWAAGDFLVEGTGQVSAPSAFTAGEVGGTSRERVSFAPGSSGAEIQGSLAPGESRSYVIGAGEGQFLYARVAAFGPDMYYQIFNPDGSFLLDQMTAAQEYRGQLWQSGDHVVEVINRGSAETSYSFIVGIE
ncbi:SH3 domain-containing protein [Defluviimonas sp. WL0002]|uniref:SH3 domain-containing protein n=1 Tax=Albidovulum marisflavi TaxID=2984159 RepID=A0ABT2ZBE6_9RHOB|nr:SH3 domain-containing protein [Defluviimonas sp. WL0002]MCV2868470.1 SH3 domain-containing protein [Defluviimonas sp. WL0002]